YQLVAGGTGHRRFTESATATGSRTTLRRTEHFEQENLLLRLDDAEMKPGEEPDFWQWAKLTPIDPQPFSWTFDAGDLDLHAGSASLTLNFRGASIIGTAKTVADHVVEVSLNGRRLAAPSWDGRDERSERIAIPRALLKERGNTLTLRVPQRAKPGD